jgi:NAD(P)H-dependent FMN reductase
MPRLNVVTASTRPGRTGPAVTEWIAERARDHGAFDVEVVDLAEVDLPFLDEPEHAASRQYTHQHTLRWSATVDAADAFVFVTPEYNNSYSAPLKNALDYLYSEWHYKPVGFVSYGMSSAGLRAIHALKPVVTALKMFPLTELVAIPLRQHLGTDGTLRLDGAFDRSATAMLDELRRMTDAFATVRAAV